MALCLVTGGAGFIGSRLVEALVARGDTVRVLDNFSTGLASNLDEVARHVEFVHGDCGNRALLEKATRGVQRVFHLAAPRRDHYDPPGNIEAKWDYATATLHVLEAARAAAVARVVYASSVSVYGSTNAPSLGEEDRLFPDSSHGFAKLAGEMQCIAFTSLCGMETVRLRYADTFGPRQCPTSAYAQYVPLIVKSMLAGQPVMFDENIIEHRDFVHVEDVVHATLLAADAARVSGQVYNIGAGRSVSLLEVVAMVNQILKTNLQPVCKGPLGGEAFKQRVDISRAERDLGYCPSISMWQGLVWLVAHYAEQGKFPVPEDLSGVHGMRSPHFRATRPAGDKASGSETSNPP